jgi:hypothetical protein
MDLIIQIAIVIFLIYATFTVIAAISSINLGDGSEIWDLIWVLFGYAAVIILLAKNPGKSEFCEKLFEEIEIAGLNESEKIINDISDNIILKSILEVGAEWLIDEVIQNSGNEFCSSNVKRTSYFLFSSFTATISARNKIKFIGIGGYFFKIDRNSFVYDIIQ